MATIHLQLPISFIILHFICDWLLQNDWMALNKSKDDFVLAVHALVATSWCLLFGWEFWTINLLLHYWVDYFTSRGTSKLWFMKQKTSLSTGEPINLWRMKDPSPRHWFFCLIGFDQVVHYLCLAMTYKYLGF